jgi:hypothetical protein
MTAGELQRNHSSGHSLACTVDHRAEPLLRASGQPFHTACPLCVRLFQSTQTPTPLSSRRERPQGEQAQLTRYTFSRECIGREVVSSALLNVLASHRDIIVHQCVTCNDTLFLALPRYKRILCERGTRREGRYLFVTLLCPFPLLFMALFSKGVKNSTLNGQLSTLCSSEIKAC